jgi:histidine triad (HIT) family protein
MSATCVFCRIVRGEMQAVAVVEEESCIVFLDHRPLFPGHCLVVPRPHHETLSDLPTELVLPLFSMVQRLSRAVPRALGADGSFVAINNRISQSVPHLHVHVVPRRKGDGLRGFFWPRVPYASDEAMRETAAAIRGALVDGTA